MVLRTASAPDELLRHIPAGADPIVPLANGEPVALLDAPEDGYEQRDGVRIHQMHALHERPYLRGECGDHLRHVSYFLSAAPRQRGDQGRHPAYRPWRRGPRAGAHGAARRPLGLAPIRR
jgi:hypothetical protein